MLVLFYQYMLCDIATFILDDDIILTWFALKDYLNNSICITDAEVWKKAQI